MKQLIVKGCTFRLAEREGGKELVISGKYEGTVIVGQNGKLRLCDVQKIQAWINELERELDHD